MADARRHFPTGRVAPAWVLVLGSLAGCASPVRFPAPLAVREERDEVVIAFATGRGANADYWQFMGRDGRKRALAFAEGASGTPGPRIELDAVRPADCPHLILALDGVPFEVVAELRRQGYFRLFHRPSRVICSFPSMTDLGMNDLLHTGPSDGYQAPYYDRAAGRVTDSNEGYLRGANSPWLGATDYRCSLWWDVLVYLNPQAVFDHELRGILRTLRAVEHGEVVAYSVGTAGLGTRGGRPAIEAYLKTIDRMCEQIVHARRGRVKITLTADHGHNLTPNRRVNFSDALRSAGYRPARSLRGPRDVVTIEYGLVTYASFCTDDPAGVAACLAAHPAVEFACYPADDAVMVVSAAGRGVIRSTRGGLRYEVEGEDPLRLGPILADLREAGQVGADGTISPPALFAATVEHVYPDPLARVWRAFHGLVRHPPDVIANLRDGTCHGSSFFNVMVGRMESTHGSLNAANSTTFVLSMIGELPPALRTDEILPRLRAAYGE